MPPLLHCSNHSRNCESANQWVAKGTSLGIRSYISMKPIIRSALCGLAAVVSITGMAVANPSTGIDRAPTASPSHHGVPVVLTQRPGSSTDRLARQLMAQDLANARRYGQEPLVLVGTAGLGPGRHDAVLFVQLQSASECGSAGCTTVTFRRSAGSWTRIADTVSGPIQIAEARHRGMPALVQQDGSHMIWDGTKYRDVE